MKFMFKYWSVYQISNLIRFPRIVINTSVQTILTRWVQQLFIYFLTVFLSVGFGAPIISIIFDISLGYYKTPHGGWDTLWFTYTVSSPSSAVPPKGNKLNCLFAPRFLVFLLEMSRNILLQRREQASPTPTLSTAIIKQITSPIVTVTLDTL